VGFVSFKHYSPRVEYLISKILDPTS